MSEYNNKLTRFPKDWEVKKLKDIIIYKKGIKPKELHIKKVNDNYLPYLTAEYLRGESEPKYVNPNENKIIVAEPEDILMIWDGSGAGDLFIGFKGIVASTFVCIKCNKNIIYPKYLYYYLLKKAETLKQRTKGTGIPHINKETFENLLIPIPPLEEQKKIVEILNSVDSTIIDTINLIEKLKLLKEKTLNLLITGKIWHKEFKDTEIGKIPKNWEVVKLGEIAKISSGNTAPQEEKYFKNGKYPFIRVQHLKELQEEKFPVNYDLVNDYALSELKLKLFKKGCIIFPKSGESIKLEKRAILKEDSCVVNHLAVIEPLYENIDNLFLFYYLCTIKTSNYLTETTMPSLNLSTISNFLIPLPPLEEQKKIVEILSTIDKKIETETKYLDYMKKLKEKLLAALMTGKIRVNSITIGDLR
jgi:type I restriction enzyme S subunit